MILTGDEIDREVRCGNIVISDYENRFVEPNSYGFHLGNLICFYESYEIDSYGYRRIQEIIIPEEGYCLLPDRFSSRADIGAHGEFPLCVPELYARLSTGLSGIFIQTSAPLGHTGAIVNWTLEIVVAQPVRIYPGMLIGKICFWENYGEATPYSGRYAGSTRTLPSLLTPRNR